MRAFIRAWAQGLLVLSVCFIAFGGILGGYVAPYISSLTWRQNPFAWEPINLLAFIFVIIGLVAASILGIAIYA